MKELVLSIILVSGLFLLTQNAFAENLFYGSSSFEKLPSIISDEPSNFELKIRYTEGPYAITKLTPIFDVSPKDAKPYVQIKTEPIEGLYRNNVGRIQGNITVDPQIQYEKVFVSVYFNGMDLYGNSYKSAWMDSAIIDINKQTHESSPELDKEKSTCLNQDPKVPLYGCSDVVTVKIDSPLKQFKSGVPNYKIICKEGLKVLIRSSDDSPACVKPDTATKLQTLWHKSNDILLEHFKNKPEVKAFYAKYERVIASVKDDHMSYSAGNKTDFRARMNLYFDENYAITNIDLYCYVGDKIQYEIPYERVVSFVQHYTCSSYRNGDPLTN